MASSLLDICARYVVVNKLEYNDEILPEECIASLNNMEKRIILQKIMAVRTIQRYYRYYHSIKQLRPYLSRYDHFNNDHIIRMANLNGDLKSLINNQRLISFYGLK